MTSPAALPGFLAVGAGFVDAARAPGDGVTRLACGGASLEHWGLDPVPGVPEAMLLSRVIRSTGGATAPAEVAAQLRVRPAELGRLLPPFAAVIGDDSGVTMVADSMGLRQLYHGAPGPTGEPVMSTSALSAGGAVSAGFDETAVAVQSQLGWQLGQRTLLSGVLKLAPGDVAHLGAEGVRLDPTPDPALGAVAFEDAVREAAALLRASLEALLDDHPDAVLQLTGGQDSRILLSAIPPARRRGLRAMTLGAPGDGDVAVAGEIAARYGLEHEVHGLGGLDELSPEAAWALARDAAARLDGMADPLALAALTVAESAFPQGVRISGLGGEVARGFYYVGSVRDRPFTRRDAEQLAAWRMFVNESVESDALDPDFQSWATTAANDAVFEVLAGAGAEWFRATDELYLRHRMQRWAGVTDTAVAYQRVVINPMLDESFLTLAGRLTPQDKAHSRFLAALQMELDPELGRMRLEGRPAPISYARPGAWSAAARTATTVRKAARKAVQRARRGNRAPAGGTVLAGRIVEHWRRHPELVDASAVAPFVRESWLADVIAGRVDPRPSSVAFLTNLMAAAHSAGPR